MFLCVFIGFLIFPGLLFWWFFKPWALLFGTFWGIFFIFSRVLEGKSKCCFCWRKPWEKPCFFFAVLSRKRQCFLCYFFLVLFLDYECFAVVVVVVVVFPTGRFAYNMSGDLCLAILKSLLDCIASWTICYIFFGSTIYIPFTQNWFLKRQNTKITPKSQTIKHQINYHSP